MPLSMNHKTQSIHSIPMKPFASTQNENKSKISYAYRNQIFDWKESQQTSTRPQLIIIKMERTDGGMFHRWHSDGCVSAYAVNSPYDAPCALRSIGHCAINGPWNVNKQWIIPYTLMIWMGKTRWIIIMNCSMSKSQSFADVDAVHKCFYFILNCVYPKHRIPLM